LHKKGGAEGRAKGDRRENQVIRLFVLETSQNELGELLGVNQSVISRIETGRTGPSVDMLLTLSRLSGKTIDWMMKGE